MKDKFFNFIRDLKGTSYLEYYITYLISPVLTGVKPSSLIGIGNDGKELLKLWEEGGEELAASLGLKTYTLKKLDGKEIVLIYNEQKLVEVLKEKENSTFLKRLGYVDLHDINKTLTYLYERYNMYQCPHEIGVFLGIPLCDVEEFMNCSGRECILCGYWKVFSNEEKAKELFKKYDQSKEMVMAYSLQGKRANWIAHRLNNSFSCSA
jgi:hypothetical protein